MQALQTCSHCSLPVADNSSRVFANSGKALYHPACFDIVWAERRKTAQAQP